jgi:hypothetical protein
MQSVSSFRFITGEEDEQMSWKRLESHYYIFSPISSVLPGKKCAERD